MHRGLLLTASASHRIGNSLDLLRFVRPTAPHSSREEQTSSSGLWRPLILAGLFMAAGWRPTPPW